MQFFYIMLCNAFIVLKHLDVLYIHDLVDKVCCETIILLEHMPCILYQNCHHDDKQNLDKRHHWLILK